MYKLSNEKQEIVLSQLVEGFSLRAIERMTGTSLSIIIKILLHYDEAALETGVPAPGSLYITLKTRFKVDK